ncbi:arginine/serine-rich coiled-coil protein 2 [Bactrocera neohumeralis]|uniref:arginine/serine-rich coiled-coil protein 2 n=1 Tax=Bactrocera neohumeralis TaxID=98809 RepID=UPI0021651CAF|nr:arginine/serine-rich coiled-coil protein 2 [Bactrocera neohumeralis]XP_050331508.1 arginine/serine-rich coiled-coil protein 2 [Bactrocera neohumeralis]XP_050331509.1 arginine/serine-rich coiled-coil protein 2 [Bactrocera neohumeralis]
MYEPDKEFTHVSSDNTLTAFIDESKSRIRQIFKRLEWNFQPDIARDTALGNQKQKDIKLGIDFEPYFPPSCASDNFSITDVEELRKVLGVPDRDVPKRFSDLQVNFSRTEKLSLYEHIIANTKKYTEPEITVQSLGEGSLTFAEIVAQKKRETKKRRRYRRSKPTHIEEVRAVVDLQMQSLQQYLKDKESEKRMNQLIINEKYKPRSDRDGKPVRDSGGRIHTPVIIRNKHRSRSRSKSYERQSHKKIRYRSRSRSDHHRSKKSRRDLSSSKSRKHQNRSRSPSGRKIHKRHSRSRSPLHRSNTNRNKLHYRQRE